MSLVPSKAAGSHINTAMDLINNFNSKNLATSKRADYTNYNYYVVFKPKNFLKMTYKSVEDFNTYLILYDSATELNLDIEIISSQNNSTLLSLQNMNVEIKGDTILKRSSNGTSYIQRSPYKIKFPKFSVSVYDYFMYIYDNAHNTTSEWYQSIESIFYEQSQNILSNLPVYQLDLDLSNILENTTSFYSAIQNKTLSDNTFVNEANLKFATYTFKNDNTDKKIEAENLLVYIDFKLNNKSEKLNAHLIYSSFNFSKFNHQYSSPQWNADRAVTSELKNEIENLFQNRFEKIKEEYYHTQPKFLNFLE